MSDFIISNGDTKAQKAFKVMLWLSPIVIVLLASLQHYLYEWTHCPFVALWSPINESVWEHGKLVYFSTLVLWFVYYYAFRKKVDINASKWLFGGVFAATIAVVFMINFNYFCFAACNLPNKLFVHIPMMTVALVLSQLIGFHIWCKVKDFRGIFKFACVVNLLMVAMFVVFTFAPLSIELFRNQI